MATKTKALIFRISDGLTIRNQCPAAYPAASNPIKFPVYYNTPYRDVNTDFCFLGSGFGRCHAGDPAYLADGWELYPNQLLAPDEISANKAPHIHTFAGRYLNLSGLDADHFHYEISTWRLRIRYDGSAAEAMLDLPEVFSAFTLWVSENLWAAQGSYCAV